MTPEERKKIDFDFDKAYADHEEHKKAQVELERQLHDFGIAPIRAEGRIIDHGFPSNAPPKNFVDTTYIEFSLPREWEKECEEMIENWLKEKTAATGLDWN